MASLELDLNKQKYPKYNDMIETLVTLGYSRVSMVLEPNEFSCRGDVIDIYASNHSHPIRLEYFDTDIERMMSFNPNSQRSISAIEATTIQKAKNIKDRMWLMEAPEADEKVISSFQEGDFIVHENYGIGVFSGLVRLNLKGQEGEYIHLKYKGKDQVYVPLDQFKRLHKYSGHESEPTLNGLHDGAWKKTKQKVKKATAKEAEQIFMLYKIRLMKPGFKYAEDTVKQLELENDFPHELTRDQKKSVHEIKEDMEQTKPMDRLLCGDVGYGKTEVLLRAAFKAVENGKQVAVLVPTTILAEQHYQTFEKRFTKFGYTVDVLSRFKTKKQQKLSLEALKENKVNVIIGTHRLLQKDVIFSDLGLLIVDEEQRFGVSHKERIKQMKELVDVISVSATPIPRTLYMALSGAKDLSVIETPPKQKKPVVTHISEWQEDKVKKAIKDELKRKGQVFYIFNNVQNIHRKTAQLKKLFPKVSIEYAHGQMKEKELQDIMMRFFDKKIKVLVCTTIIENGLDITSANTIILEEANRFGLSQIHQLRGRVGRTNIQGHCYLFFTSAKALTDKAQQRLQAIREYASLGSGYKLAMKDLEIRGAGELIGTQQSGQVSQVGFELYCKMLEDAVKLVKGETVEDDAVLPLDISKISIPEDIIEDPRERFALYTRLYQMSSKEECDDLHKEVCDRYGKHKWKFDNVFRYVKDVLTNLQ